MRFYGVNGNYFGNLKFLKTNYISFAAFAQLFMSEKKKNRVNGNPEERCHC